MGVCYTTLGSGSSAPACTTTASLLLHTVTTTSSWHVCSVKEVSDTYTNSSGRVAEAVLEGGSDGGRARGYDDMWQGQQYRAAHWATRLLPMPMPTAGAVGARGSSASFPRQMGGAYAASTAVEPG